MNNKTRDKKTSKFHAPLPKAGPKQGGLKRKLQRSLENTGNAEEDSIQSSKICS